MNFNPERISIPEQKGILENERHLDLLYERIEKKLSSYRPNPEDFRDIYKEEVDEDISYVEQKKLIFEDSAKESDDQEFFEREKKIALIAEGILTDQLSGEWLNVYDEDVPYTAIAHPTSDYDDIRNGADLILEVFNKNQEESRHLGLSIDITFSSNKENLQKKMKRIIDDISGVYNLTPQVKYFESDFDDYRGAVDIARSVIVLSRETVEDLFKKEFSKDKIGLSEHPVQLSILAQLEEQAETFLSLCKSHNNQKLEVVYQEVLNDIKYLKKSKREKHGELDQDPLLLQEKYNGLKLLHRVLVDSIIS